ncbi:MAG: transporter [Rariglobus sp.]|jgi:hypothetical protein|nr:transporter [Rariglobus sp.]
MSSAPAKKENLLINLVFNILIPTLVLSKLSKDGLLGPVLGLVVALAFPLGYGVWDFLERRKANFIAVIGFLSVLLTGGFALTHLNTFWFAVKEAGMSLVIGSVVLLSAGSKQPLVRTFLYNDQVIDTERVAGALSARNATADFNRLMRRCTWYVATSFLVSALLNFVVASWVILAEPGTPAFNEQLAVIALSNWIIIMPPFMVMMAFSLWQLFSGIKKLTGLELDAIIKTPPEKTAAKS